MPNAPGAGAGGWLLAGDVGGTKAVLALAREEPDGLRLVEETSFASASFGGMAELIDAFLAGREIRVERAAFSVAGPVVGGRARLTNLDWTLDPRHLSEHLRGAEVLLVNDLQATAFAVPHLEPDRLLTLQEGTPQPGGVRAVIAVGTGLGEALLVPGGPSLIALPTEGGHTDFAPTDALQRELLEYLDALYDHVSYERVCSGRGIATLYRFLRERSGAPAPGWLQERLDTEPDPTPVVVGAALDPERRCPVCEQTLDLFVSILGAEAGNLALRSLALGGVYLGGGVPPRLLPLLRRDAFLDAFRRKGPMSELVRGVPVRVILEPRAALLGALRYALAAAA